MTAMPYMPKWASYVSERDVFSIAALFQIGLQTSGNFVQHVFTDIINRPSRQTILDHLPVIDDRAHDDLGTRILG